MMGGDVSRCHQVQNYENAVPLLATFLASEGCSAPRIRSSAQGTRSEAPVAVAAAPVAIPHPKGPRGVQPKNWLTPGVWTMDTSAAVETT